MLAEKPTHLARSEHGAKPSQTEPALALIKWHSLPCLRLHFLPSPCRASKRKGLALLSTRACHFLSHHKRGELRAALLDSFGAGGAGVQHSAALRSLVRGQWQLRSGTTTADARWRSAPIPICTGGIQAAKSAAGTGGTQGALRSWGGDCSELKGERS